VRPSAIEALRGVQEALLSTVAPELQTMLAQDTVQTVQMVLESLAAEWDTAADTLFRDNRRLGELLSQAREAVQAIPDVDPEMSALLKDIESVLEEPPEESLALSKLAQRNERLRGLLERTLVWLEDREGAPEFAPLMSLRNAIYMHLRQVAARGWSFWDVFSFRERMARLRADPI